MDNTESNHHVDFGFERVCPDEKTRRVQAVFNASADQYDIMNDLMSLGLHYGWKKKAVEYAHIQPGDTVLDLACGTCDITYYLLKRQQDLTVFATDPNEKMLNIGRDMLLNHGFFRSIHFSLSYAEGLPYPDDFFQVAICAFGFRNFTNHARALAELYRVIRPGGQVIILEFSKPSSHVIQTGYRAYAQLIPSLGELVAQGESNYQYLVDSIEQHMDQAELSNHLEQAGFLDIRLTELLSGLVCIHRGIKC